MTLVHLPHDVQNEISIYLRPHARDPMMAAPDLAALKATHRNFKNLLIWRKTVWKKRILKWIREKTWRRQYPWGIINDAEAAKGFTCKYINDTWRGRGVRVEMIEGMGRVVSFSVSFNNLVTGVRPLPSCFGRRAPRDGENREYFMSDSGELVPVPTYDVALPAWRRKKWLWEVFRDCMETCFAWDIKQFKKDMQLPPNYDLSRAAVFKMFLEEIGVSARAHRGRRTAGSELVQGIDQICD